MLKTTRHDSIRLNNLISISLDLRDVPSSCFEVLGNFALMTDGHGVRDTKGRHIKYPHSVSVAFASPSSMARSMKPTRILQLRHNNPRMHDGHPKLSCNVPDFPRVWFASLGHTCEWSTQGLSKKNGSSHSAQQESFNCIRYATSSPVI